MVNNGIITIEGKKWMYVRVVMMVVQKLKERNLEGGSVPTKKFHSSVIIIVSANKVKTKF